MIKSSLDEALAREGQISSAGNSMELNNVANAFIQGVSEHVTCEQLYEAMQGIMKEYAECVAKDAKYIKDIAWGFDEVDQSVARNARIRGN